MKRIFKSSLVLLAVLSFGASLSSCQGEGESNISSSEPISVNPSVVDETTWNSEFTALATDRNMTLKVEILEMQGTDTTMLFDGDNYVIKIKAGIQSIEEYFVKEENGYACYYGMGSNAYIKIESEDLESSGMDMYGDLALSYPSLFSQMFIDKYSEFDFDDATNIYKATDFETSVEYTSLGQTITEEETFDLAEVVFKDSKLQQFKVTSFEDGDEAISDSTSSTVEENTMLVTDVGTTTFSVNFKYDLKNGYYTL